MIELNGSVLNLRFPEIHPRARASIKFMRTVRIPDDGRSYPLPPGLGEFPVRQVDRFPTRAPEKWLRRGGVMMPMYNSEALWLRFACDPQYPIALKVAAGKINAVTGDSWSEGLHREPQDYLILPKQPWLDGYCTADGEVRQFIAMPLGGGFSAEEQLTGKAEFGGLQIKAFPLRASIYRAIEKQARRRAQRSLGRAGGDPFAAPSPSPFGSAPSGAAAYSAMNTQGSSPFASMPKAAAFGSASATPRRSQAQSLGLGAGGRMRQQIFEDAAHGLEDWEQEAASRCFIHLCPALLWREITGSRSPLPPLTAREYSAAGYPWFDHYAEGKSVKARGPLKGLKSVSAVAEEKGIPGLPDNASVTPENIQALRWGLGPDEVRDGAF